MFYDKFGKLGHNKMKRFDKNLQRIKRRLYE